MKLTPKEKQICKEQRGICGGCPLCLYRTPTLGVFVCYCDVDGRTTEAKELKRYN